MKHYPSVSIVISNYNGVELDTLKECLSSFRRIDYPNYELILVDNASTDESVKLAKKILGRDRKFRVIQNEANMYSLGLKLGFDAAIGDYVAFFNNDLEVGKKYFHNLVQAFAKYPKLGLAQGKLLSYFDHSIIDSAGETMDIYGNPVTIGYRVKDNEQFNQEEEVLSASGSACIVSKSAVKRAGNYDTTYGIGYEDMDLALRVRQSGFSVMRIPSAICYHKRGTTDLSPMVRIKAKWDFNKNRLSTMIKNYPGVILLRAFPLTLAIFAGNMFWEIIVQKNILLGLMRPWAVIWVMKNMPKLLRERSNIRRSASWRRDREIMHLFAPSSIWGKIQNVVADYFNSRKD